MTLVPSNHLQLANTLANRIDEYLASKMSVSASRAYNTRKAIAEFAVYLNRRDGISPSAVAEYGSHLQKIGNGPSTIAFKFSILSNFFSWLYRMRYTEHRWDEYLPKVRVPAPEDPKIVQHSEYLKLIETCRDRDRRWLIALSYNTGMRLGDCCKLKWSDIDRAQQFIHKKQSKTARTSGSRVMIPYISGSEIHQFIDELWLCRDEENNTGEDYVCPSLYLSYISNKESISHSIRRIFRLAGIPGKSFKHLRCTFESRLANSGMNLVMATKISGRSDPRQLMRYVKPDLEAAREGVAKALDLHNHLKGFA